MKYRCIFLGLLGLLFVFCESESPLETDYEQVVVQAYLYANQLVQDIRISRTLPLGSEETTLPPVNNAVVQIFKNGQSYDLIPSGGDSGYYHYSGEDLTVQAGDKFEIHVDYFERTASGETVIPEPPGNVSASGTEIYIPEEIDWENFEFDSTRYQIRFSWDGDGTELFFVKWENIEENPDSVESDMPFGFGMGRTFLSAPSSRTEYTINYREISFYGRHKIEIYRVNQEYADLYISRQQDSRDLNEPLTNIDNGLGIFSAFNSATLYFDAVPE
jgi:hypothetical protein